MKPWGMGYTPLYSRRMVTQTLTGNEKLFELAGFWVVGID